jgi:hypothetical protein
VEAVKPAIKARMDSPTACLVATGSGELAISIAPRFSAPNSSPQILRGKLRAGGRKPWLAAKFGTLLESP